MDTNSKAEKSGLVSKTANGILTALPAITQVFTQLFYSPFQSYFIFIRSAFKTVNSNCVFATYIRVLASSAGGPGYSNRKSSLANVNTK